MEWMLALSSCGEYALRGQRRERKNGTLTMPTKSRQGLAAFWRSLDGESVFEFFHAGFQILNFSPLLFDEEVFNPVQSRPYLANLLVISPRNS
jgi:hypothetical protein